MVVVWVSRTVLLALFLNSGFIFCAQENKNCSCHPMPSHFNENIESSIKAGCRKCFQFTYDFTLDQDWAARVCIDADPNHSDAAPLLVTVREYLSIFSFQVPQVFSDRSNSSFYHVCHTLCPLANYDEKLPPGKQSIYVEVNTQKETPVHFIVTVLMIRNFTIPIEHPVNVNITPSQPQVMQYNLQKGQRAERIEIKSPHESCMVLAIQSIQCPFYDSEKSVQQSKFYQTLMTQSAIALTKNFPIDQLYIVLLLKTTNDDCLDYDNHGVIPVKNIMKEVTVTVVATTTDSEFYWAIFGALGIYVLIYIFTFIICLCIRRSTPVIQNDDVERGQDYGTSSGRRMTDNIGCDSTVGIGKKDQDRPNQLIEIDETDMDKMSDVELDENVIRTKTILHVTDLARKKEKTLSKRSKLYSWNLLTIAVFYSLPVIQLVYINQRIVYLTGDQDICYYNFLCSYQLFVFSDFNHIYSNIGYCMLGLLFMCLVWRREIISSNKDRHAQKNYKPTGLPDHFGLQYAMGLALILEGVLSACYHVCPNRANFQFDTTFMYVISLVCMLKLYQARHPDITARSHITWMTLSVVIFVALGGLLDRGIFYWIIFVFIHLIFTLLVSFKIYYMGCIKYDRHIILKMYQHIKQSRDSRSYGPEYKERFWSLFGACLLNFIMDVVALVLQPNDAFAVYILMVFIVNLFMYLIYYIAMKFRYKEPIGCIPYLYFVLTVVCTTSAIIYYLHHNTEWELTPAKSRENNERCIILNFYDHHDVWHFLSSCAVFFFYMVLFTLDDKIENKPRKTIKVF